MTDNGRLADHVAHAVRALEGRGAAVTPQALRSELHRAGIDPPCLSAKAEASLFRLGMAKAELARVRECLEVLERAGDLPEVLRRLLANIRTLASL
jgi:hypothetical protein